MSDFTDEPPPVLFGIPMTVVIKALMFTGDWADAGIPFECRSQNRTVRFQNSELRIIRNAPLGVAE